jgi:DNA-binding CsgD family transcriptional regulator
VPSLVRFGQSPDADLLYRTLVSAGPRSAVDLAGDLGMALSRVGRALDELASAGAVETPPAAPSRPPAWRARPPAEVVATLRRTGTLVLVALAPVVAAHVDLSERRWEAAREPPDAAFPAPLRPRERALIALLASGHTEIDAARELRISRRTVTNVLRGLMDRLGVDNRFQLGLVLGERYGIRPSQVRRGSPAAV